MPETVETTTEQQQQEPQFDSAKFIEERNKATAHAPHETRGTKAASVETKTVEPETKVPVEEPKVPRHVRREMNRLREEAAEARGRLAAIEEMRGKPSTEGEKQEVPEVPVDPEPQRKDFANDADYNRALGRWDARQEARKELGKRDQTEAQKAETQQFMSQVEKMTEKATEDRKLFADWDEVTKALTEGESDIQFSPDKHPQLMALLAGSDVRAFLYYHFGKQPAEFQKLLDLTEKPAEQIRIFHRLEGAVEKMYTPQGKGAKKDGAGPSSEKKGGDANPADSGSPDGRNAAERDARKPKPSTEVAARGGSAPPDKPEIGSAAWMAMRNRAARAQ